MNTDREQTPGEEIANSVSHGLAMLLSIAALPVLVAEAASRGAAHVVGASLFAGTMILLYAVSAVYHAAPAGQVKRWLMRLDHASIYLFIAGSYMPFVFGVLWGAWGWTLFGIVWAAALLGVASKLLDWLRHPLWSTGLYLAMGWSGLIAAAPLIDVISGAGLAWLVAGGLAYSGGVVFFLLDSKLRYAHFAWHLCVMAGSTCHFFAALWYAAA
jgi:hemolysin III